MWDGFGARLEEEQSSKGVGGEKRFPLFVTADLVRIKLGASLPNLTTEIYVTPCGLLEGVSI